LEKVVEPHDTRHQRLDGCRQRQIRGVGEMNFGAHLVAVDPGMECRLDLARRAAETDKIAAACGVPDGESLRAQPEGDFVQIGRTRPEPVGVGLRRQPIVIVRRCRVLLFRQQLFESGLPIGRRLQHQGDVPEREIGFHRPKVVLRLRLSRNAASNDYGMAGIDRASNAILLGR